MRNGARIFKLHCPFTHTVYPGDPTLGGPGSDTHYPGDPTLGGPGSDTHYWVTHEPEARAAPPVRTAAAHTAPAHALIVRGTGVAWGEGAPVLGTRRTDSHCTCAGGLPAFPASTRVMIA